MDYSNDKRIVMTLDAGGTNFVFSAFQGNQEIIKPIRLASNASDLKKCLQTLKTGFMQVKELLSVPPTAISFAFPGPADYENGVIGDLPNLPAFRGGVALKGYLEDIFHIPVFINNDGNLFAYGEALAGTLPYLNKALSEIENPIRYHNLVGITLGTGFGCGVVIDGQLLLGDNGCGGDVWLFRDKYNPDMIAEASVSIRAIKRMYSELSGNDEDNLTPKDICDIAAGKLPGNKDAALQTFHRFGRAIGNTLCYAVTLIDGIVVIGGGLAGAAKYFMPAVLEEMRGTMKRVGDTNVPRLQMDVYDLNDPKELLLMLKREDCEVRVPDSNDYVPYIRRKKIGITISRMDTSMAINLGAYNYALNELDKI